MLFIVNSQADSKWSGANFVLVIIVALGHANKDDFKGIVQTLEGEEVKSGVFTQMFSEEQKPCRGAMVIGVLYNIIF